MKRILYLFAFLVLCSFKAEDPILALLKKLEEFTKKYPAEKVYLHLDKPNYAAGDDIWFKAYVTDWKTGEPTALSSILYIELINQNNSIEKKLRLPMQSGVTWGDFKLADTLAEGNYRIRAYTQWMRNAGPEFFFDKTIKIGSSWTNEVFTKTVFAALGKDSTRAIIQLSDEKGSPLNDKNIEFNIIGTQKTLLKGRDKTNAEGMIALNFPVAPGNILLKLATKDGSKVQKTIPIKMLNGPIAVQFLPEGGPLVQGIESKIGIKAIGTNGLGLAVKGKVVDQLGIEVSTFETSALGMGAFNFTPAPNKTYTAKLTNGQSMPLPKAAPSGYVLSLNTSDSTKITAKIKMSANLLNKGELTLVSQKNGAVYWDSKIATTTALKEISYEKKDLPQGIVQFTLFSSENVPVCERIVFIDKRGEDIAIDMPELKATYQKKEKVELTLSSSFEKEPLVGSFSVAVTRIDAVKPDLENESHIKANLLLSSDLMGYVEKPNTYFLTNDTKTTEALDHLMLTQGWRKIDWKLSAPVISHEAEKGIKISGVISKNKMPLPRGKVSLITNKDGMFAIDTESNDKGEFKFQDLEFIDSTKFIIQARTEADKKEVKIDINLNSEQEVNANPHLPDAEVNVNQSIENYLKNSTPYFEDQNRRGLLSKVIVLKEVKITADRASLAPNSKNLNGPGNADQIIDVAQIEMANSLSKYLQGRISGVTIDPQFGFAISRRTFIKDAIPKEIDKMRVILDGNDNGTNLGDVDVRLIESIEVITSMAKSAIYGPKGQGGLIIVTTKTGAPKYNYIKYAPGVTTYTPQGYYAARTFYSPKYDVAPSDLPDLRTTVFWAPNLVTDEEGKVKFDYFNTDQPGNYRMVIEGIDSNGNLARKTYTYTVN